VGALLALGLAGVPARAADDPRAAAQHLLDARAAAIAAGDRAGFLATVDPDAPAAFRQQQAASFDGWRSVPVTGYRLQVRTDDSGDLGIGLAATHHADEAYLPETRQTYRLRDFDDRDEIDSLWLTFVRRGSAWFVASDGDLDGLGLQSARQIWETSAVQVTTTAHFLVINHPAQAARAAALASIAEEAAGRLDGMWDQPWPHRIPLILPGSVAELERLLQSTIDLEKFVAFVDYGNIRDEGWVATAPRIFIQDKELSRYDRAFQLDTLTHELSHGAGATVAGPLLPVWLHEGLAEWIGTGRKANDRPPSGSSATAPHDEEFSTGSQAAIVRAYGESRSLIAELAREKGTGAPTALFAAVGAMKVAPGNAEHAVDDALRRLDGIGLADLERSWAARR
jgi:hypothetical protein